MEISLRADRGIHGGNECRYPGRSSIASGDNGLAPTLDELRQRIDQLTPTLPDSPLSRTEVATLMMAMRLQGVAIALSVVGITPISPSNALDAMTRVKTLSDDLIDSLGKEWPEW